MDESDSDSASGSEEEEAAEGKNSEVDSVYAEDNEEDEEEENDQMEVIHKMVGPRYLVGPLGLDPAYHADYLYEEEVPEEVMRVWRTEQAARGDNRKIVPPVMHDQVQDMPQVQL